MVFRDEYRFLSNFVSGPVVLDGITYPTVEHAYQAAKTLNPIEREIVRCSATPGKAKRAGRSVTLRKDWGSVKVSIMTDLVFQKFEDKTLANKLLATGEQKLEEGNFWHDNFWGNCKCDRCSSKEGKNWMGRILEMVRAALKHSY